MTAEPERAPECSACLIGDEHVPATHASPYRDRMLYCTRHAGPGAPRLSPGPREADASLDAWAADMRRVRDGVPRTARIDASGAVDETRRRQWPDETRGF